jgi:rubrerythrin
MGSEAQKTKGKPGRLRERKKLFCPECGYAVEFCRQTRNFHYCPLCLREGKESLLEQR